LFLPFPLLAALLVVAVNSELLPALPGSSSAARLLPCALLLLVPSALASAAAWRVRRELTRGRASLLPPRALLRLSELATPLVVHGLFRWGAYSDMIDRMAGDSHLGRVLLSALPAFVAEVPRIGRATLAATWCDIRDEQVRGAVVDPRLLPGPAAVAAFVRMRLGGPLLVAMPLLLLGGALELLQLHRGLYAFVLVTTPGITLGAIVFVLLVVTVLPFWFRIAFATRALPEPLATRLRAVARALGFPPGAIHLMPTGMCALNAMLVGPLPLGRSLCLTDGLVRELDAEALAGVVAHEVGHARRGHPAILLALAVVASLLLFASARMLEIDGLDVVLQSALLVTVFVGAWLLVRRLAHRFEHEADIASVQALGAGPCSRALLEVSRLALPVQHTFLGRAMSLHPDEPRRWEVMRRYDTEPGFRAAFDERGRALRRRVLAGLVVVAGLATWAGAQEWRYERVVWRLYAGDHAAALELANGITEVPARWQRSWQWLQEELAVVRELAPAATDWPTARAQLAPAAWARGEQVWLATGPAAARPYLAMALGALAEPTVVQRALYAFCRAVADNEPERAQALAALVRQHGVPPQLAKVFAE
jgi:Zn-dependent protease with chaperone function